MSDASFIGPPPGLLFATVFIANLAFGLMIGVRTKIGRRRSPGALRSRPSGPIAQRYVTSPNASMVLICVWLTAAIFYVPLVLWMVRPSILGSSLVAASWPMYALGVILSICGLWLLSWTYAVFRSWRWRAEIEPGHMLMTDGPFARVRHPIYLSLAVFYAGAFFLLPYTIFLLHAIVSFVAYDIRARVEERVLLDAFGDDYRRYQSRTYRYFPGVY